MKNVFKRIITLMICLSMVFTMSVTVFAAEGRNEISADKLLASLSLEQKIGQMIMPAFRSWTDKDETVKVTELNDAIANAIKEYGFGGVILFAENVQGTRQATKLIGEMQRAISDSEHGIPLLVSVDQEGGYIYRLGTGTDTCGNMALGASGNPELAKEAAEIIGREIVAEGFNVDFAPTMDVNSNPANPVIGVRSYSDDPNIVAEFGSAFIAGLHEQNLAVALKHFPGHGDTETDSHSGLPLIDKKLAELEQLELVPFKAGIAAGADMIMTAHIQYPQIEKTTYISKADGEEITLPATLSKTIITDVLRKGLGFDGVVVTDAMNMGAIDTHFDRMDAACMAINAGVDILLMPVEMSNQEGIDDMGAYIDGIKHMVIAGKISEKTIDVAVKRILDLKIKKGLFVAAELADENKALQEVGSKANHDTEWDITEKAITLVKNNGALPFKATDGDRFVLFCAYSNEVNSMNFALERLKDEGIISKNAEYKVLCYQSMDAVSDEYANAIKNADAVLASVETTSAKNLKEGWQSAFMDDVISIAHENNKKIAVISLHLPYDVARYQTADALLAAYSAKGMSVLPSEYNGETTSYGPNLPVAVYTAFGGCIPNGKLPVNIPKLDEDNNYMSEILYQRGYGITGNWNFIDIPTKAYYVEAADWAAANGVTDGIDEVHFGPNVITNRAQMVTFLWKAAGKPEPTLTECPFIDVKVGSYYYKAVLWAYENGITDGITAVTFEPARNVNRAQTVTFLWRYAGRPVVNYWMQMKDVVPGAYYAEAVRWALAENVTEGTNETTFSPNNDCLRCQIVTFLYRYFVK